MTFEFWLLLIALAFIALTAFAARMAAHNCDKLKRLARGKGGK